MNPMRFQSRLAQTLRRMYAGGRGNAQARRYSRLWARIIALGVLPRRWVVLQVPGRRTGRLASFPLGMADVGGSWYVVSMLGDCNWTKNVRAAGYRAVLRRRRALHCRLVEIPADQRAPVLRRYLQKVHGARAHIPVASDAPLSRFDAVAAACPVFRVEAE